MDDGTATRAGGRDERGDTAPGGPGTEAAARTAPAGARQVLRGGDEGMATAEYAIATLAACGFAGLLVALLRSDEVRGLLLGIVRSALSLG